MDLARDERLERKLDLAARAAWLYYIAGNTQEEIAAKLNLSRQAAQRLVSLAVREKLVTFRLDHRLAALMALAARLTERFELAYCDVVPSDPDATSPIPGIASAAAGYVETFLAQRTPLVLAFTTGRTLRALVGEVAGSTSSPHRFVSIVGSITRNGRTSPYEVVLRLAERVGAECYPMPTPVVREQRRGATPAPDPALVPPDSRPRRRGGRHLRGPERDRKRFTSAPRQLRNRRRARLADRPGCGGRDRRLGLRRPRRLIEGGTNDLVAGIPLTIPATRLRVAVGGGIVKAPAIRAALRGRLITGLITDEATAQAVLEGL